jgi:TM2 domain-containing membrane protein YozV
MGASGQQPQQPHYASAPPLQDAPPAQYAQFPGQQPYGQQPYAGAPYGQQQYAPPPYGQPPLLQQPYGQPYPPMQVAPKSPGIAVLASFLLPGLGSMISGRAGRGWLILGLYVLSWILTIVVIGLLGVVGCWIWGMIQGYNDAVAWNRDHGIVS